MVLLHVERQDARPVFTCEVDKVPKKAEAGMGGREGGMYTYEI